MASLFSIFVPSPRFRALLLLAVALIGANVAHAQSVLGSIFGTVRDSSGAAIPNASVLLHRVETNTNRTVITSLAGNYEAINLEAGTYEITASANGFSATIGKGIMLTAREQLRFDAALQVASAAQNVIVNASSAGVINTDNAQISAVLSSQDVEDLPANYRGAGSTSPLNVVQAPPDVQPDTAGYPPSPSTHPVPSVRFSIQGGLPSQSETTVDGILAQNQTANNIQSDAFPSAESISEIRVDGVNNNAEYGQPSEITTVTKSGTNHVHGSAYEYIQNQLLDAIPFGTDAANKPRKVANDFGFRAGGPVFLPHLYDGRNRTFVFGAYEGLRYPQSSALQAKVPTVLMKQGDFSKETTTPLANPFTGGTYANNIVPVNPSSAAFLQLYPDPSPQFANESLEEAVATTGYNYLGTRRDDISSNQFDIRGDHTIGQRASIYGRYTWKTIGPVQPADLALPNSTAFAQYRILASGFTLTTHIANEFRFGFTLERDGNSNPFDGTAFNKSTGLDNLTPEFFNGIPHLGFNVAQSIGSRLGFEERSRLFQYVDNVTIQRGNHSIRVGVDIRQLNAYTEASGGYGSFYFNSGTPGSNSATGQEFADFLIGVPYQTNTNYITSDNNGVANSYAFYGQDTWKVSPI